MFETWQKKRRLNGDEIVSFSYETTQDLCIVVSNWQPFEILIMPGFKAAE